ncbi:hypothetical protein K227x_08000 [Rubripirellula lacrimiformis]|uniref:AAA+ ATPase domain-containing protein n=1 Tax=Rubripirellula lacrimiformis TaxID=1930273 RepID=A0A517N5L4_9BACT|nr:hypothetical protein [Rubripirellula lacrimiformis]QDT02424.1 hypothetical protein K227x_08000 [Rubripirellula lacrimiformis]
MNLACIDPDRWQRHNLIRNPFGELTKQERARLAIVDLQFLDPWIGKRHRAVQFVGDCGRGKTTRMLAIAHQWAGSCYVYLPEDGPTPPIPMADLLLIDEAQRLPGKLRRRVFATGMPLVLATHRDLSRSLARQGYQVHTESIGDGNDVRLIQQILNARIEAARWKSSPVPEVTLRDAEALFARFGSDIRQLEHFLYDRIQNQVMGSPMKASQVIQNGQMRFVD